METPAAYSDVISPRSRRLRVTGIVLLVAVAAMALYGYFSLMPSLERSLRADSAQAAATRPAAASAADHSPARPLTRAQRVRKFRVAVALAYWGVCALLVVAIIFIAWLDLREISRMYVSRRRQIWVQSTERLEIPDDGE